MDTSLIVPLVAFLQTLSAESMALLTFLGCAFSILLFLRFFGALGLYTYNVIILIVANIQVLKQGVFWFSPEPVALGTVAFATTFLVSDILTEHYGKDVARKGIGISFAGYILMTGLMLLTLGYSAPAHSPVQESLMTLFVPTSRLLFAGLLAYGISQVLDISLFDWIAKKTHRRWLWLRVNVATFLSGLVDNIIFSVLAWVILNPAPISMHSLLFTYILGTYFARALVSVLSTPIIYLSYRFLPRSLETPLKGEVKEVKTKWRKAA